MNFRGTGRDVIANRGSLSSKRLVPLLASIRSEHAFRTQKIACHAKADGHTTRANDAGHVLDV